MNDNLLLELTEACYNKVESEFLIDIYLNSSIIFIKRRMLNLLECNGFSSLHNFTQFLINKYQSDLDLNEIFDGYYNNEEVLIWVVIPNQRQILLSFFKSVIRDLQLKQLIQ
jgi:predicted neutral ceramidase superfamily lipid hydrolase